MKEHLELLGLKVRDVVTGLAGVVTSVSFDVSGCIQGLVVPEVDKNAKESGHDAARWFDTKRLERQLSSVGAASPIRVMKVPTFEVVPGGQDLPGFAEKPIR